MRVYLNRKIGTIPTGGYPSLIRMDTPPRGNIEDTLRIYAIINTL